MVLERSDWERLDRLLASALDRPAAERDRWLDEACGGDSALKAQVAQLVRLAADDDPQFQPGGALPPAARDGSGSASSTNALAGALAPGRLLGRYEILGLLGSGGMGSVYRARDPALDREVAIKALARAFHDDSASLRRFEREARVLATLSHPNIASIYGFEVLDGAPYLILERVEGETLADRLRRGALPVADSIAVAVQIAEGLEEAHAKGVIHRDLKPSNVMLGAGGRVKLVDFGLAKSAAPRDGDGAESSAGSPDPTTAAGTVIGTVPYMSPEQVQGRDVDTRTDVWAFGCVVYEMLAGRRAFPGRSVPEILAALLRDEPDWAALPASAPPSVRRVLHRCLRKDAHERVQHIGDVRLELTQPEDEAAPRSPVRRAAAMLPWALAGVLAVVAAWALWPSRGATRTVGVVRLSLELPRGITLATDLSAPFALDEEGTSLVFAGVEGAATRLYVRDLAGLAVRPLAGTDGARQPFLSPDGRWIGFFADRKLKKVPLAGGAVLPLADVGGNPRGASWAPDGSIVLAPSQTSGLVRLVAGEKPQPLTTLDPGASESSHRWPEVLPGGRWVLFTVGREDGSFDEARIEAVSLATGERRKLVDGAGFARYVASGHLAFVRAGRLHVAAFDPDTVRIHGEPEVVLEGLRYDPRNGAAHLFVSGAGALVYNPGLPVSADHYLSWLRRDGGLARIGDTPRPFRDPRLGPDGRHVAVVIGTAAESDLWTVDASGTLSRLTFGLSPRLPAWTPDGHGITVGAAADGRWRLVTFPAAGKGERREVFDSPRRLYPNAWSADARRLVFQEHSPDTGWDLKVLDTDGSGRALGAPRPLAATPANETHAALSADGGFVAYESDEVDGVVQIYVRSFPEGAAKVRAGTTGGRWPRWGRGGELYYWDTTHHRIHGVRVEARGGELAARDANPQPFSDARLARELARVVVTPGAAGFDIHSGERALVMEASTRETEPPLSGPVIVIGWAEELRSRER